MSSENLKIKDHYSKSMAIHKIVTTWLIETLQEYNSRLIDEAEIQTLAQNTDIKS